MRVPIIMMALSIGGSEMSDSSVMIWAPRAPMMTCAASAAGSVERARLGTRQHRQQREVDQQVDDDDRDHAADHRLAAGCAPDRGLPR